MLRTGVGVVSGLSLLLAICLVASSTAQAQYPYGRDRYGYDIHQIAQDQGYRDGVEHGAEHAREGHRYDPEGTRHYKGATSGYRSSYGSKDAYKQAYRQGFRQGYDEGFNRYGGYDRGRGSYDPYYRNDPYRHDRSGGYGGYDIYRIAQDQGYRDGVDHGAEYARERASDTILRAQDIIRTPPADIAQSMGARMLTNRHIARALGTGTMMAIDGTRVATADVAGRETF